jgi:hypothetical protein
MYYYYRSIKKERFDLDLETKAGRRYRTVGDDQWGRKMPTAPLQSVCERFGMEGDGDVVKHVVAFTGVKSQK